MDLYAELVAVARALEAAGVDHALVGGLAVAVWGAPRATKDIDLLVRREDLGRAGAAIAGCGYTLEAFPMEFSDGMEVHRRNKIVDGQVMTVDFLVVDRNTEPAWQTRAPQEIEGATINVISRDALIRMKLAAGRPQDTADVVRLTEQDR